MAIRLRRVNGVLVALCAARSVEKPDDVYLDDAAHHALAEKFAEDFQSEGYNTHPRYSDEAELRAQEESNNQNREWWDRTYGIRSKTKNVAAAELGRLGGLARAARLGPADREGIAYKAAKTRWNKRSARSPTGAVLDQQE